MSFAHTVLNKKSQDEWLCLVLRIVQVQLNISDWIYLVAPTYFISTNPLWDHVNIYISRVNILVFLQRFLH
jgi:hypothetical protein